MPASMKHVLAIMGGIALGYGGSDVLDHMTQKAWDFCLLGEPYISNVYVEGSIAFVAWLISCLYFTYLDVTRSDTKVQKDYWPTNREMLKTAIPQLILYPLGCGYTWYLWSTYPEEYRTTHPKDAPPFFVFMGQLVFAMTLGDFILYWQHRIFHIIPYLRNHVHSVHHEYSAPFGWAGGWVHPLEDATAIVFQSIPAYYICHPMGRYLYCFLWTIFLIDEHSGHDVWWSPSRWVSFGGGGETHDIHHYFPTKNYGFIFCFWDKLFGTYLEPSALNVNPFVPPLSFTRRTEDEVKQIMDAQLAYAERLQKQKLKL
eukprot:TRINITY_DN2707_c0_g1_i1.p1 TRINITY_DN2707_c0_g1~~TRINITY_DN2707_c0_g1_i1.p1  ORF type:complete len:332 (+),score=32.44 TRINITY_DN2707_c0_g1_i1:55-996(+)